MELFEQLDNGQTDKRTDRAIPQVAIATEKSALGNKLHIIIGFWWFILDLFRVLLA